MLYFVLKFLHVIGGAVLLGTGAGIAFFMLAAHVSRNPATIAGTARIVVRADFLFTTTAVVVQPITGALLAWSVGYSLLDGWIVWSIALYLLTGAFWFLSCGCRCACAISLPRHCATGSRCRPPIIGCSGYGSPSVFRRSAQFLESSG